MSRRFPIFFIFSLVVVTSFFIILKSNANSVSEYLFLKYHLRTIPLFLLENFAKENFYSEFLKGRINFVEGHLKTSKNNFTKSIEINPNFAKSYYGRGLVNGFLGQNFLTNAENDFLKYLELEDKNAYGYWAGHNDLAWIYFLMENFSKQEEIARKGLEQVSGNAWLQNMLGTALLAQKKCSEGKKHLELAKMLSQNQTTQEFGEAYSGDDKTFWENGKKEMERVIEENLHLCEKQKLY
jgi:tetratricopeptide (TPR) repeat protein